MFFCVLPVLENGENSGDKDQKIRLQERPVKKLERTENRENREQSLGF